MHQPRAAAGALDMAHRLLSEGVPGCDGDQGTTYYWGNVFQPADQSPYPRDRWFCIEVRAEASTVGSSDGSLTFWIDDAVVGVPEFEVVRTTRDPSGQLRIGAKFVRLRLDDFRVTARRVDDDAGRVLELVVFRVRGELQLPLGSARG